MSTSASTGLSDEQHSSLGFAQLTIRMPFLLPSRRVRALLIVVSILILAYFSLCTLYSADSFSIDILPTALPNCSIPEPLIPRRIWQIWTDSDRPGFTASRQSLTWPGRNPGYEYHLLSDASALAFVKDHYRDRPDIIRAYEGTTVPVIRADLFRYLALIARGGIYSDYDTESYKSIDLWTGNIDNRQVGMILGIEYDQRRDRARLPEMIFPVQFAQWTLASRPDHPVLRHVVNKVIANVLRAVDTTGGMQVRSIKQVLNMTGPGVGSKI